jgi:hypothetical protein
MKRFDHKACVRSLDILIKFFEKRVAEREASRVKADRELIGSARLDLIELKQLRRWVVMKRYVTATRFYLSLDTYLRAYVPKRTWGFFWDEGWKQYVTEYADGIRYAKRHKQRNGSQSSSGRRKG